MFNTFGESGRTITGLPDRTEVGALIGPLTITLALLAALLRPIRRFGDALRMTGDEGAERPAVLFVGVDRDEDMVKGGDNARFSSMGILCCGLGWCTMISGTGKYLSTDNLVSSMKQWKLQIRTRALVVLRSGFFFFSSFFFRDFLPCSLASSITST